MPTNALAVPRAELRPGDLLAGRFRLLRMLGSGSMGIVWLTEDAQLENELLACKILRADLGDQRDLVADLKREVLLTRKLRHPNILALHTFWETTDAQFVTMEYVEGMTLAEALADRRAPFTLTEVLPWLRDLASGLDYAHSKGVLHRDVKPANALLGNDGRVYLADFGIARLAQDVRAVEQPASGTIYFMSPEQVSGESAGPFSDLYSLAASIYLLLSGTPPFYEGEVLSQIQVRPPAPVATLPEAVNRELLRALSKSPGKRHRSCGEFYESLRVAADSAGEAPRPDRTTRVAWAENAPTVVLGNYGIETRRTRLGRLLVERDLLTQEQLAEALIVQRQSGGKLGAVLIAQGHLTEEALATVLSEQLRTSTTRATDGEIDPAIARAFTRESAERHLALPLKRAAFGILVAMVDPLDMEALNRLEETFGDTIEPLVATESDLWAAIGRVFKVTDIEPPMNTDKHR